MPKANTSTRVSDSPCHGGRHAAFRGKLQRYEFLGLLTRSIIQPNHIETIHLWITNGGNLKTMNEHGPDTHEFVIESRRVARDSADRCRRLPECRSCCCRRKKYQQRRESFRVHGHFFPCC